MYSGALLAGIVISGLGSIMIGVLLFSGVEQAYGQTNVTDMTGANMTETTTNMTTSDNMTAGAEDANTTKGSVSGGLAVSDEGASGKKGSSK